MQNYARPAQQPQQPSQLPQMQPQRPYAGQPIQPMMPGQVVAGQNIPMPQQIQARALQAQHMGMPVQHQHQQQPPPTTTAQLKRVLNPNPAEGNARPNPQSLHRKRKPTDRALPALTHDDGLDKLKQQYERLLELEKSLDVTYTRKRAELVDDSTNAKRTVWKRLRVRMSTDCADQEWQQSPSDGNAADENDKPDFETGKGIPSWTMRIQGQLLDLEGVPPDPNETSETTIRFSQIVQHLSIDLQRPEGAHREPGLLNWQSSPNAAPTDGFSFKRSGTVPVKVKVSMYLMQHPKRFKVAPDLGDLLDLREETKTGILVALWAYIQRERLIENTSSAPDADRRNIRCDDKLQRLFGKSKMPFHQMSEAVNNYLSNPDPVVLEYTIDTSPSCTESSETHDIFIELPDPFIRSAQSLVRSLAGNSPTSLEIMRLDEAIASSIPNIRTLAYQHSLLSKFSKNPAQFMQDWLRSQSLDLQDLLDPDPSAHVGLEGEWRLERLRDAEWFKQDWVKDAVGLHIARSQANPAAA